MKHKLKLYIKIIFKFAIICIITKFTNDNNIERLVYLNRELELLEAELDVLDQSLK